NRDSHATGTRLFPERRDVRIEMTAQRATAIAFSPDESLQLLEIRVFAVLIHPAPQRFSDSPEIFRVDTQRPTDPLAQHPNRSLIGVRLEEPTDGAPRIGEQLVAHEA